MNTPASVNLGGTRNFVFVSQSISSGYDCTGTAYPLPTATTTNHYDCQDNPSPCYGDLKTESVSVSDGSSHTTTNTYSDDTTHWILGELTQTSTNSVVGTSNITRTEAFTHDPTSGQVTADIVEPTAADCNGNNTSCKTETDYTYDAFGNVQTTTVSGPTFASRQTTKVYSANGAFLDHTYDQYSHIDYYAFDARFGGMTSHTDPNGEVTAWTYDTFGRRVLLTRPDGTISHMFYSYCSGTNGGSDPCSGSAFDTTEMQYASDGVTRIAPWTWKVFDALTRNTSVDTQAFDGIHELRVTDLRYDANGHVQQSARPRVYYPDGVTPIMTTYTYDALGRVTQETDPNGKQKTYAYKGLLTQIQQSLGQTSWITKNAQGLVASSQDSISGTTTYTTSYIYDAFGNLTSVTDPAGNVTTNSFDRRGNKTASNDPDMGHWTYTYDGLGELLSQTDAKAQTTTLSYDLEGRLTQRVQADQTDNWVYDTATHGVGKLASESTSFGYTRTYAYDSLSRPSSTTIVEHDGAGHYQGTFLYAYTYDANGRLGSLTYPSGLKINYGYTALSYLQTETDANSLKVYWTATARDAELHLTHDQAGNGVATSRSFDPNTGLLTGVAAGTSNSVASFNYTFDLLGNLTNRQDNIEGTFEAFCYDAINRLTSYAVNYGGSPGSCPSSLQGTVKTVGYDPTGNMLWKSDVGTYSYPAVGQPYPHAVSSITGVVNGVTNPSYTYDANGNMTAGAGRSATYTTFNMTASLTQGTTTQIFLYDPEHQRTEAAISGGTAEFYLNDPVTTVMEQENFAANGAQTYHDFIMADGKIVADHLTPVGGGAASTHYMTLDHLGSIAVVTDDNGNVVERDAYDAWGKNRNLNGTDDTTCTLPDSSVSKRGFTSQEQVQGYCLINYNARVYDPQIGRFMTPDDVVPDEYNGQSLNRYTYVDNRPVSATDPTGHFLDVNDPLTTVIVFNASSSSMADLSRAAGGNPVGAELSDYAYDAGKSEGKEGGSDVGTQIAQISPGGDVNLGMAIGSANMLNGAGKSQEEIASTLAKQQIETTEAIVGVYSIFLGVGEAEGADVAVNVAERLQTHLESALERFEESGFTNAQKLALERNPNLEAAYKGERIDTFFKDEVRADSALRSAGYRVTARFEYGPDVYHPELKMWFDVTTPKAWVAHVTKYTADFGDGSAIHY